MHGKFISHIFNLQQEFFWSLWLAARSNLLIQYIHTHLIPIETKKRERRCERTLSEFIWGEIKQQQQKTLLRFIIGYDFSCNGRGENLIVSINIRQRIFPIAIHLSNYCLDSFTLITSLRLLSVDTIAPCMTLTYVSPRKKKKNCDFRHRANKYIRWIDCWCELT